MANAHKETTSLPFLSLGLSNVKGRPLIFFTVVSHFLTGQPVLVMLCGMTRV
jgi:hypothetical protein